MKKLQQLEEQYKKLGEEIERLKLMPSRKLEYRDRYWTVHTDGDLDCFSWGDDDYDEGSYNQGNVFLTEEAAESEG